MSQHEQPEPQKVNAQSEPQPARQARKDRLHASSSRCQLIRCTGSKQVN